MNRVFVGADHRGFELKKKVVQYLQGRGLMVQDLGALAYNQEDDFNDSTKAVVRAMGLTPGAIGILICGSGQGVNIQANRYRGIRAIVAQTPMDARLGREHLDANILVLPADFLKEGEEWGIMEMFFGTPFSAGERYIRRIQRLDEV
jgi:ribose 5-phosphate isomerase B